MSFDCPRCRSPIEPQLRSCPRCGEAVTDFLRRHSKDPLDGKYRIVSLLGVGGMGEVYKAEHVHLDAPRVIKLMHPAIESDLEAHERFLREARLATKIQHPNVAALFDFSMLPDGSHYMVWEFIEGTNLLHFVRTRGHLEPEHAVAIATQVLAGLDAIHKAGIVHRDMSPENVMITQISGDAVERAKIIDLGVAKQWAGGADEKTKTGMFVGKLKYCSPEQLGMLPDDGQIDGRADLYSFALVLYEMLTGVAAFQAETPHHYVVMHISQTPKPLWQANRAISVSPELEAVIFRALEKDRERRFRSAIEFSAALRESLSQRVRFATAGDRSPAAPGRAPLQRTTTTDFGGVAARRTGSSGSSSTSRIPRKGEADAMLSRRRELLEQVATSLAAENYQQAEALLQTLRMHLGVRAEGDPELKRAAHHLEESARAHVQFIRDEIERARREGRPEQIVLHLSEMEEKLGKRFGDSGYRIEVGQWLRRRQELIEQTREAIQAEAFAGARELLADLNEHLGEGAHDDQELLTLLHGFERAADDTTERLRRSIEQARAEDDAVKAKRILALHEAKFGVDSPKHPAIADAERWVRDPNRAVRERKTAAAARDAARRAIRRRRRRTFLISLLFVATLAASGITWRNEVIAFALQARAAVEELMQR
ncbi:MAG TPA: serine/threonine-protein kinase [Thermoanaerobaculia bacterium]|nr:serine/threonine-protein kinase [Thermoanaerobaculia bacterium]